MASLAMAEVQVEKGGDQPPTTAGGLKWTMLSPSQQVLASSVGACVSAFLVTPFDVVKTRLQSQSLHTAVDSSAHSHTHTHRGDVRFHYRGNLDAVSKIVRYEGVTSLWRGLSATLVMTVPSNALYLGAYERLKSRFLQEQLAVGPLDTAVAAPLFAGMMARALASVVSAPVDYVRTILQAQPHPLRSTALGASSSAPSPHLYTGLVDGLRYVVGGDGASQSGRQWTKLWRGYGPTFFRDVPFSAVYWSSYDYFRAWLSNSRVAHGGAQSFMVDFTAGGAAGMLAAATTTPMDVVKTRMQVQVLGANSHSRPPLTARDVIAEIWLSEGPRGFFRGLVARVARVAPACAVMISSYELFKTYASSSPIQAMSPPASDTQRTL